MVDYSKANSSRQAKNSFDSEANEIHNKVNELQEAHGTTWLELEALRKEMAANIEHVVQIVKSCGIKTPKPLGHCNNQELNEIITDILPALPFKEREEVQVAIIRINNRYEEILKKGAILEDLAMQLSKLAVPEKDMEEEVVLSLNEEKVKEEVTSGLQKVESVQEASDELYEDLLQLLNKKKKSTLVLKDSKEARDLESTPITNLETSLEDIDLTETELESLYASRVDEKSDAQNKNTQEKFTDEMEDPEYYEHAIKDDQTILSIASQVYGEKEFWENIYLYEDNCAKIEKRAYEYNMTPEEACNMVGVLSGLTLKFPLEIIREKKEERTGKLAR